MLDHSLSEVPKKLVSQIFTTYFFSVPEIDENSTSDTFPILRLYRVPLEHFPSLERFYPERIISSADELESVIETKPTKTISSQAKKSVVIAEIDKTAIAFDEKIKEIFRQRYSHSLLLLHFISLFISLDNPMHRIVANVYVLVGMTLNFITIPFTNNQHEQDLSFY